ncbi:hypothetical protein BN970_01550 [Mycolicibacterium conceptionense]|uniref:Uncharacterized protein n=2 Tax=Mycolicibacterium conceptionense TaxID=451644 RepID=A0A0U1D4E9_9MYCO|nr:hypothetical protein [Mycolicibacterium conceptionense]CQD08037.1 hypothetical protein BN970_01550 [Mycolicibacterium conceptionense]
MTDLDVFVPTHFRERLGWDELDSKQRAALGEFGYFMYRAGKHVVDDIDRIKYDGRLVILDDGSRWEVDSVDTYTVDSWRPGTKVAVIDDVMYNLGDAEHADVSEED